MRSLPTLCSATLSLLLVVGAAEAQTPTTIRVASGLVRPVFVTHAPGDSSRIFIVEKRGVILVQDIATGAISTFLDINAEVGGGTTNNSEQGLLGAAFHPDYLSNGFFYVDFTNNSGNTRVWRYTVLGDPATSNVADATSNVPILSVGQPQSNHNAGWIGFSPADGYLYVALGDGGNFCDFGTGHAAGTGNAQLLTGTLLGKILRIDVDGGSPYAVPATNPFVGIAGDDEIWSYGLRNPYRCSFDRMNGDLYIGDVGQDNREEVDYEPAGMGGVNYGWRCREGAACANVGASSCPATTGCGCPAATAGMVDPIWDYTHSPPPAPAGFVCSVVGGYVYRGACLPSLQGHYFFADFCGAAIWSFVQSGGSATSYTNRTSQLSPSADGFVINDIVSFGEDNDGEMYIVDQGTGANGQVFRIVPEATAATRNAGTNPFSYQASPIEIGGTFTASVDNNVSGQSSSLLFAFDTSTSLLLSGGQTLLAIDTGGQGELFSGSGLPPSGTLGGVDTFSLSIPNTTALCGINVFSQAIQFGSPPFALSNANDLGLGY